MNYSFFSKKLNQRIKFCRPGKEYIFVVFDNGIVDTHPTRKQICYGGGLQGNTITYSGDDEHEFERICKLWWRKYLKMY